MMSSKFEKILKNLFIVLFIMIMLAVSLLINKIVGAFLYLLVISFVALKAKKFKWIILIIAFSTRIISILIVNTPITADWELLYESAKLFSQGNYSFSNALYFQIYAFQTGLVIINGLLLKICDSVIFLKLINCLAQTGIIFFIYQIVNKLFGEKTSKVITTCYTFSLFPMTYVSVLSNAHYSAFFVCFSIYLLIVANFKRKWLKYILAGVLMAIANAIRSDVLVINVALLVCFIFNILHTKNKKEEFINLILFFVTYFLVSYTLSYIVVILGINPYGLSNNAALYKVAVGTGYENLGLYSDNVVLKIASYEKLGLTRSQAELSVIKDNFGVGIISLIGLFINKIQIFWSGEGIWYSLRYMVDSSPLLYNYIQSLDAGIYNIFIIFSMLSGFLITKKEYSYQHFISYFILFASFVAYLFLEIATCYSYLTMIFLFISAAPLVGWLLKVLEDKFSWKI